MIETKAYLADHDNRTLHRTPHRTPTAARRAELECLVQNMLGSMPSGTFHHSAAERDKLAADLCSALCFANYSTDRRWIEVAEYLKEHQATLQAAG